MRRLQRGYAAIVFLVWLAVICVGGFGWVENIVKLVHSDNVLTGMGIARAFGIVVAPLGAVLGYL